MHIITGKDKLNIKLNKYGQLIYGKKVGIYLLCLILMSMSSYKPNLNCLSSGDYKYLTRHKLIDLMFVPAQTASAFNQRPFVTF